LEKIGRVHVVPKISSRTDRHTDTIATILRHAYRGGVKSFSELNRRRRCRIRSDDGCITQILHPCYRIVLRTAVYYKSVISLVPRLSNMTLPAFAAERRAAAPLLLSAPVAGIRGAAARSCRSISPARTALSSKPAARRGCGARRVRQKDRRTPYRFTDPSTHTKRAVPMMRSTLVASHFVRQSESCFRSAARYCDAHNTVPKLHLLTLFA